MDAWATGAEVKERPETTGLSDDHATLAARIATDTIVELSGNRFGTSTRTVRPEGCGRRCEDGWGPGGDLVGWGLALPYAASFLGPEIGSGPAGGVAALCGGCSRWSTGGIELSSPVVWDTDHPIVATVDGTVLDAAKWSIVAGRILIRTDGGIFPQCQDLRVAATEVGTCAVTYSRGVAVPEAGKQAAISLAVEFARLYRWTKAGECRLPQRLQTITRQGVTATVADNLAIINKDGGTGITEVDLWVKAVNPKGYRSGGSIVTPGHTYDDVTVVPGSAGAFV